MVRRNARGGNWLHVCGDIAAKVRSKSLLKLRAEGSQSPGIGGVMGNARSRRVRFQQDNKKSQSLETPYHHSHQQQKLGVEMEGSDMHERAASFTSIHQYANAKVSKISLAPPRPHGLLHQRSISLDDVSMSSASEHEKWEKEAIGEHMVGRAGTQAGIEKKRANFKQQRSYSFNDLSPAVESEKWEKEAVSEMVAEATKHKKKTRHTNIDAGPTEIVVPPLPVPVQSTPPVVPPAVAAAAAAPAAAGPEDAAAASSKQASTTAPACTSGDKRKTPKSDTVESLREDSFDPCNWSPIEDSDTGEDPHHAAKPETTAQIEKDPDKVTMIHGRSDQSGPNGPAGRPNPYVDKTPVFRSSMESGTLARRDGKFSMSPQSIKRVSREGASVDGSSPKSGRASGEVDLSPVPAVHRSSREPRRDARPPCLTGLQRSAPRPSREAVSPNSLSDRSRNKDQDISPSHRKLSPSSGTGSYNLHATSPGGRERSGSGGRSSSRRSYRDSNIPKRSPTDPSTSDRYHTPQGKPELRGVSESEVRTPQTKYSKQPNVDSCDICTAQPVDTSHKPEGQSQRQLYHDWDSNSQEVSRREFRGRRDFITPSEETPVNISVEQSVADIHHPPADVRVYPASPQYPENDRPPGKYVTKQFTTVDNKSQFLLSTPTQKPCHRRSLPAITTDMYKHMDSKKATATGCSPRNRTLLLLHERRSRSFDSYVDDKHTDHEQYPEQVNDRENINVDQSVNTPATKPDDYPSQHVVEGRDLKTDSVDINKTPADPTMSVPPTLYKKADYRDEKGRLRHKDTPDYRQTKKYEPSSPDYSGKHSLPIKDTSPRRQLPSPRKGTAPSRYPEDNARPRTHPADMPERDAQGSYKYRSASDTRHSAENREKTLISDYYRLRHSDNDSFYKSSMSSMQASTDGVKERRKRLLQQKKSQSLDAMCDPSEGDEAAQKLSAPEKTGREVSPSRQTDSGTRYLPRRVSKRNLLKVMHEGRSRSFDSPYEDECPVDHEWTPPPHHPHHSDSPPRDYTHKTHTTGENWDREKNKHIKNHPQENISERERERDYEYSQVMASKDGRRPRPCHAFSMPQEVEPVYSLRVAKDLAEEKRRQSYTPGVSSNEYRHRGHSPHDCEMRRVRQAAAANSENQRHTQPFDREHGWSEESGLPRESEHRKKSAECESHALKHPSLPLDKPRRRSRQITEDDARPRQVSCQDDLQSQHFKRDSIRSSRSPDPTGAMSASTRGHKERPEGVTGHKIETAKSRRLHHFHHQKSHSVDVPEKASEVESQRLADSKPLQRSYPIDEKSNGLSGIRKKSIGDLMNEIAQLKPQKSGDVRGSAERAALLSVFSDMRDTDDGVERKKSKKRARFQQQKSYSLDIPSRSGRPPSEKKESTLPKPARVEAPVSPGTIISESRDKSPNTTRVKRTVQFQTQKSYSLDVLVTEDEEENKTSMSCNVETSYRKRVASDTSDGPNCSGNGEYKSSGSNRQKLIQMRAMKLKAENEDNSTSSDKKTKGASPNIDQGKQRLHGGSERSSSQVRREADMLRPELESQTRSGTSPPRHSERKRSPGRDKEGTNTSRDRESHSQRRRDRERDSEKRRDQKSVSKYRDVQEIPKHEVRKREGHSPGREVDYYMSQREPSDHPEPREWERYHHQSPVQGQTRRASCSPSRDAEGRTVHQQSFSPSRDESRQSPGRGRKRSPSSRETTHTSTAGGSPLGSPGTQGGDWRNLTKADLIKAIQERLDSNPLRDSSSSPKHSRRQKLNMRMKSFSLDAPDTPRPCPIEDTSRQKSTGSGGGGGSVSSPAERRRGRAWIHSSSVDIEDSYESYSPHSNTSLSPHSGSRNNSRTSSPKSHRRSSFSNQYVVLYNFKGKEKDDLDVRAGSKVSALETTDPDWWKGMSGGRVGYFPANYVKRLRAGDKVMQVAHPFEISDRENKSEVIRLLKDQIVIQEEDHGDGMVVIRTSTDVRLPCPVKYLTEVS